MLLTSEKCEIKKNSNLDLIFNNKKSKLQSTNLFLTFMKKDGKNQNNSNNSYGALQPKT